MSAHDLHLRLESLDPERLGVAEHQLEHLLRFPEWNPPHDLPFLQRLGENLFHLAFPDRGPVDDLLARLKQPEGHLRIWLDAPDLQLARLPWEYLCLPGKILAEPGYGAEALGWTAPRTGGPPPAFLALHPRVSLVRGAKPGQARALAERIGALRVLIAWADPDCDHWGRLSGVEIEIEGIIQATRGLPASHLDVQVLPHATERSLAKRLALYKPQVLHISSHGGFPDLDDPGDLTAPTLVLEAEADSGVCHSYLTADELAARCADSGVRVVVLNACWGGHSTNSELGLAAALQVAGVPVVVAMSMPVPQSAAVGFAEPFYEALMVAHPLEEAVQIYRLECARNRWGAGVPDWGIPSLFLAVADSALFATESLDPYPLNFRPLIRRHVPIVGRGFLFERLDQRLQRGIGGIFLLTAAPGLGKTAFAAQWAEHHPGGAHWFFVQREGRTDPDQCLRSLYVVLLGRYGVHDPQARSVPPIELRERLRKLLTDAVGPRCTREGGDEVILIDALDEAGETADRKGIGEILPRELPPRVHLLLTSRPTPMALALAREPGVEHLSLEGASAENLADAAAYARRELDWQIAAEPQPLAAIAQRLAERVGGNFLVLHHFLSPESLAGATSLAAVEARSERLTPYVQDLYQEFLDRILGRLGQSLAEREALEEVLGALASAAGPVTSGQVCAAFDLRPARWHWAIEQVGQFLAAGVVRDPPRGDTAFGLYHETFREFLRARYQSDWMRLQGRWGDHCARWRTLAGHARLYALRHLPYHLQQAGRFEELADTLLDYGYLAAALGADSGSAANMPLSPYVLAPLYEVARARPGNAAQTEALRLVGGALALSAHILAENPAELPAQLHGRLPTIQSFFQQTTLATPWPWLRPLTPTLTAAGGPLLRILTGHTGEINHFALTPDGKKAVSASDDSTLRVWDLVSGECRQVLKGHTDWVNHVALTPDGRRAVSASADQTLRVWYLSSGECLRVLEGHTSVITHVALTPDGRRAVSASRDTTLRVWDLATGECLRVLAGHTGGVKCVALSPDGQRAVSASADHSLRVWKLTSGECRRMLEGHTELVWHVAFNTDGRQAISASSDNTLRVWDLASGECRWVLKGHTGGVRYVVLTPDGQQAVSASGDQTLRVWDLISGECRRVLEGHTKGVSHLALSSNGERAISASGDQTLRVWDLISGECRRVLQGHGDWINHVLFSTDGRQMVSASDDKTLRVWDLALCDCRRILEGHTDWVNHVVLTTDSRQAISASDDKTLRVWDLASGKCLRVLEGHADWVNHVALTTDSREAVSASDDKTLRVWDLASGRCLRVLDGHIRGVGHFALTPDGEQAISMGQALRVWNLASGECLCVLEGHTLRVTHAALTPDGRRAISASWDKTLRVWDLATSKCLKLLKGHMNSVKHVALTPDGRRAVSASWDKTLRVWDLLSGECLNVLKGHSGGVRHVALTPDGRRAVSASRDQTLRVWDLLSGECLNVLEGHTGGVRHVALTADGQRAVSASADNTLRLWDLSSGQCLARFTGDAPMTCCAIAPDGRALVAGDRGGAVHILRLENLP